MAAYTRDLLHGYGAPNSHMAGMTAGNLPYDRKNKGIRIRNKNKVVDQQILGNEDFIDQISLTSGQRHHVRKKAGEDSLSQITGEIEKS